MSYPPGTTIVVTFTNASVVTASSVFDRLFYPSCFDERDRKHLRAARAEQARRLARSGPPCPPVGFFDTRDTPRALASPTSHPPRRARAVRIHHGNAGDRRPRQAWLRAALAR